MKINTSEIINKHRNVPCVIAAHGPSLNLNKEKIIQAQKQKKIIRFSVNNWWDYFEDNPDYWILSSTVFTMERYFNFLNEKKLTVFYSDDGDFTSKDFLEKNANFDWLVYDQRHWKKKNCIEILKDFKGHYLKNKNFDYKEYGNNMIMWQPPRHLSNFGLALDGKCCSMNIPARNTIQETLMQISGIDEHYSTGDTVAFHAIAFAIIMGCNPIYVSGMDLDYSKGYANTAITDWKEKENGPNSWTPVKENNLNDIRILNKSAKALGISVINLNPNTWYDELKVGDFKI